MDESAVTQTNMRLEERPYLSLLSPDKPDQSTKRIFSNWGGEFFKKNLDFRANTNKILEKMQLAKPGQDLAQNGANDHPGSEL